MKRARQTRLHLETAAVVVCVIPALNLRTTRKNIHPLRDGQTDGQTDRQMEKRMKERENENSPLGLMQKEAKFHE